MFTYVSPKTDVEKKHNKRIDGLLKAEQAQRYLDLLSGKGPNMVNTRLKSDFLIFYQDWVLDNTRKGNRHAQGCFNLFKDFANKEFRDLAIHSIDGKINLPASRITEDVCLKFRQYLTDDVKVVTKTGETQIKPRLTGDNCVT